MSHYKILDNFFEKDFFYMMKNSILDQGTPWFLQNKLNEEHFASTNDLNYYFAHTIYNNGPSSNLYDLISPIWNLFDIKSLIRIKANCYPGTHKLVEHTFHSDYDFSHKGAIIYLNTNNGFTILEDDVKIESVENRVLLFDPSIKHASTNCTDQNARYNINVNFF